MHIILEPQHKGGKKTVMCYNRDLGTCLVIQAGEIGDIQQLVAMAGVLHANTVVSIVSPENYDKFIAQGWKALNGYSLLYKEVTHGT